MMNSMCNMCGGRILFQPGAKEGTCECCGTKQVILRSDGEETEPVSPKPLEEQPQVAREKTKKSRKKTVLRIASLLAAGILIGIIVFLFVLPKIKINKAKRLLDAGDYDAAYALLEEVGDYETIASSKYERAQVFIAVGDFEKAVKLLNGINYYDSTALLIQLEKNILYEANEGDTVWFGHYDSKNEWIVLDKQKMKVLVISKYAICCKPYNDLEKHVTWSDSSLRAWLNEEYLIRAFSPNERSIIRQVALNNPDNPHYGTPGGDNTQDKVFLLSIEKVNTYFDSVESRKATLADGTEVWWWLRSPGYASDYAACVTDSGMTNDYGYDVEDVDTAVRPALWIDIS